MKQLSRMVQGHEIWLENGTIKGAQGRIELRYGHNMKVDGVPPESMANAIVYTPDGKKLKPTSKLAKTGYILRFPARKAGDYTVVVDSSAIWSKTGEKKYEMGPKSKFKDVSYSGAFNIMAKKIVPSQEGMGMGKPVPHGALEIIPSKAFLAPGRAVTMKVLYEGKPLSGVELKAFSKKSKKETMLLTDASGKAKVHIDQEGKWMFLVRHKDETKKKEGEYDESVFVTTLVMETG